MARRTARSSRRLGFERQRDIVRGLSGQFQEIGQNEPDLVYHARPGVGFHDKAVDIFARGDPDPGLVISTCIDFDRPAHELTIGQADTPVNTG
ncbi:MAG: hypothetical protein WD036_09095 [Bauldia sp.]